MGYLALLFQDKSKTSEVNESLRSVITDGYGRCTDYISAFPICYNHSIVIKYQLDVINSQVYQINVSDIQFIGKSGSSLRNEIRKNFILKGDDWNNLVVSPNIYFKEAFVQVEHNIIINNKQEKIKNDYISFPVYWNRAHKLSSPTSLPIIAENDPSIFFDLFYIPKGIYI